MIKKLIIILGAIIVLFSQIRADEGMWLPLHIKRLNQVDMEKKGLQLSPEEIYSINNSSLKDAIVSIGGFCTAEIISPEGLMLTNHHCAYDAIQQHSTVENDYLTDGFWAKTKEDELPIPGLTASFLVRMEDVTETVLNQLNDDMSETERHSVIMQLKDSIVNAAIEGTHYNAEVKDFFSGNEFYLFIYETFRDVRLVGAPPSSIGKYGGDTDNWMWPRHTGDFALLRVYSDQEGKPADFSPKNVNIQPRHHLPVSLKGVKEGDFAMVMGYPGRTDRYLTSYGVNLATEKEQPTIVKIREKRLEIMRNDMAASDEVRIKYSSKHARVSNYWKYFIGQTAGLKKLKVYEKKKEEENDFQSWLSQNEDKKEKYGSVISDFEKAYKGLDKYRLAQIYLNEAVFGTEILLNAMGHMQLYQLLHAPEKNEEQLTQAIQMAQTRAAAFFKNYSAPTDKKVFAALMELYYNDMPKDMHAPEFSTWYKKSKGDFDKLADNVFRKSIFSDKEKMMDFLADPKKKTLDKDPAFTLVNSFLHAYKNTVQSRLDEAQAILSRADRLYIAGLREMQEDRKFYPNANFTMRISYGQVLDYEPRDAVYYNYYTTLKGVMEKEDPDNHEFIVPEKLKELYENKDYGIYGVDDELYIGFISNNDITGGNSGSPVINGNGELIGCAFDGNWEAMSGDIAFEPELQRTISVDIRYILFIIDKFAGAGHLVEEMTLVKPDNEEVKAPEQGKAVPEQMN